MATYEWERGSIKIPTAAWPGFKKALRDAYNEALAADFETAKRLHTAVAALIKGKRGVNIPAVLDEELHRQVRSGYSGYYSSSAHTLKVVESYKVERALLSPALDADRKPLKQRLLAPKAKDFPKATNKTMTFSADEATISLSSDKERTVHWRVPENNHACDSARDSYMGKVLFRLLNKMEFTRATGGHVYGSDEYRDEANRDNGGGESTYIKDVFGPLGEAEKESRNNLLFKRVRGRRTSSARRV